MGSVFCIDLLLSADQSSVRQLWNILGLWRGLHAGRSVHLRLCAGDEGPHPRGD